MSVDSYHPTFLAIATANAILNGLEVTHISPTAAIHTESWIGDRDSIICLAADLQHTLGEAMDLATNMFPLKAGTPTKGQTLPHHMWPKSVLHDVYAIRTRTKALRRLTALVATTPDLTMTSLSSEESPRHSFAMAQGNQPPDPTYRGISPDPEPRGPQTGRISGRRGSRR